MLLALFHAAVNDLGAAAAGLTAEIALLAHGGYGRREVSPFSDVDLMLVHLPAARGPVSSLAERLLRDVFDAGLSLGQSVCTPFQACTLANEDPMVCTSLTEARLLVGSEGVFTRFLHHFGRHVRRRKAMLMGTIDRSRCEERIRYGETVFLLEPNVKRSRGSLRDVHLLRWVGYLRYGTPEPAGSANRASCRARTAAPSRRPTNSFSACGTSCTSTPASRATSSTAPSKSASPKAAATRTRRACSPWNNSCATISATPIR